MSFEKSQINNKKLEKNKNYWGIMNKKIVFVILLLALLFTPIVVTTVAPALNLVQNASLLPLDGNVSPTDGGGDEVDNPFCPGMR